MVGHQLLQHLVFLPGEPTAILKEQCYQSQTENQSWSASERRTSQE